MSGSQINRKALLLITSIAAFLTPFMTSSVNVALPTISRELMVNSILIGWITASFLLTSAVLAIPFGRLADIKGRKKIFTLGIIFFTGASFSASLAPSVQFLIFSRVLQGIGSSMIFVTAIAIVSSVFPKEERGRAIGINVSAIFAGMMFGPVFGGILTQCLGWRSIFYIILPLGILVLILTLTKLRENEWAECKGEKLDLIGLIIYAVSLLLVLSGFSEVTNFRGQLMIITGLFGVLGFLLWELRIDHPVLEVSLFIKNRPFTFSNLAVLLSFIGSFATMFLLSIYLQFIRAMDPKTVGLVIATQTVGMVLMSPVSGRLSDKYEGRILTSFGMLFTTLGLICLAFLNTETPIYMIIFSLFLMGVGAGIFSPSNTNTIMNSVEKKYLGVASATSSTMRLMGQTLSMGLVLVIFSANIGAVQFNPWSYPELMQSINTIFTISAILGFITIIISLKR